MQGINTQPASTPQRTTWLTTYGPLILSTLALIIIAVAWILHDIDQPTALAVIGAILVGNGLVSSAQWQAAPGLVGELQTIIAQFAAHIQALHAQQLEQQTTAKLTAAMAPAPQWRSPLTPTPLPPPPPYPTTATIPPGFMPAPPAVTGPASVPTIATGFPLPGTTGGLPAGLPGWSLPSKPVSGS